MSRYSIQNPTHTVRPIIIPNKQIKHTPGSRKTIRHLFEKRPGVEDPEVSGAEISLKLPSREVLYNGFDLV